MWTGPVDNVARGPRVISGTDFPGPGSRTWRPATALLVGLLVPAAAALAGALLLPDPMDRFVAAAGAAVLAAAAAVGWRRRLVGGPRGLLITGLTGRRLVPWSTVRAIHCGRTKRMGSVTLEIDLVDDDLLLFGRVDLGTDPAGVADELTGWFAGRP
jgi:hypothetical protein